MIDSGRHGAGRQGEINEYVRNAECGPRRNDRDDADHGQGNPDAARKLLRRHAQPVAMPQPERANDDDADESGEVAGGKAAGDLRARRAQAARHVVTNDHRHKRGEEQTLEQRRGGRDSTSAGTECQADSTRQSALDQERPAFDIDGPDVRANEPARDERPRRPRAQMRGDDACGKTRTRAKFRKRNRRRLPYRLIPRQRRLRQEDAYLLRGLRNVRSGHGLGVTLPQLKRRELRELGN